MEELFLSGPGQDACKEEWRKFSIDVFKDVSELALKLRGTAVRVVDLVDYLLSLSDETRNIFVDCVGSNVWACLSPPSSVPILKFHSCYVQSTNHLMNDLEKREAILNCLHEVAPYVPNVALQVFFGHFFLKFCERFEAFYLKCLREPHECLIYSKDPRQRSGDDLDDLSFQQTVHYIGGSVVRSILKVGLQSSQPKWISIVLCITSKVLAGSLSTAPQGQITEWTESRDRGGLKFISQETWTFLMALSGVLKTVEQKDDSVPHTSVISSVLENDIVMMLWKDVVQDTLCDADSLFLMKEVCRLYVNTWGSGVAMRLKNAIPKQSRDKAPLRMSLLRS